MEYMPEEPALDPPPGVVPNFADPGGSQAIGYGIVISSSIIAFIAVLARLVSSSATKKFVAEDFLMIAALVCNGKFMPCGPNKRVYRALTQHDYLRGFLVGFNMSPTVSPFTQEFGHISGMFRTSSFSTIYL